MTIRATKPDLAAIIAAAALLSSCDGATANGKSSALETLERAQDQDCLFLVWGAQELRDEAFDRANDLVEGGAISCATDTTPSQYRDAIASIRDAAAAGDRARMLQEVGIPLLHIDRNGARRELSDPAAIEAVFDEIFDPELLSMMGAIELSQLTVERESGGFFALGALWLRPDARGGRPRIVTINRQALSEALAGPPPVD
ncbi:hypothetical protein P7228_11915 [Altererythrobacter arenosus]|uniref:Uncharacterized protein n=1 Tax=Altererythrobacter arenosus TaxID=3032592 RepID=A0ABY8FXF9_9SPHN|nr:hypothetical protein [Altererythrobacter sp. CAU 1644]WFL76699.1 hypothetical protein P7228_11915 [Altererythrobacter sp. CAU 1644]